MKLFNQLDRYLAKLPSLGGGGSSGGGSSGQVSYPPYMEATHGDLLNNLGTDSPSMSVIEAMNAAFGNSPFTGETAYDPNVEVAAILTASQDLDDLVTLLSQGTGLDSLVSSILDTTRIATAISDFDDVITDITHLVNADLVNAVAINQIPEFEAGMRDIGAVVSSAFPIGKGIINKAIVDQTAKIAGELRLQQVKFAADLHTSKFAESALAIIQLKLQYQYQLSALMIEANRLKIVAKKEEADTNLKLVEVDATWDLEVFKYGNNVLGSIAGTSTSQGSGMQSGSGVGSAIGGALSGAAAGAMLGAMKGGPGGPVGAAIGGVLGLATGLFR
jgi:hypothetical protein